ncbi:hypothetical protein QCA50_013177 [Cerrena zonata]|uniref:Uncharacterized protein n=1 Tax=Cerrena zonata TaxID=2478898 RepID=A0AAW0FSI3_9APHY
MAARVRHDLAGIRTPEDNVCVVVLGGESAGIYSTKSLPRKLFPSTDFTYSSELFPILVYCRTLVDAESVWKVQSLIRTIETKQDVNEISHRLLTSPSLGDLFSESAPGEIAFYAALFNWLRRPIIFFSWADAYAYVSAYKSAKVVEAETFVDALVYLCDRPRETGGIDEVVRFERPSAVEEAIEQMASDGSQRTDGPELSDVSTLASGSLASQHGALGTAGNSSTSPTGGLIHNNRGT